MKRVLSVALTLLLLFACTVPTLAADLQFRKDGTFRILLVADPQDDATPEPDMAPLIEAAIRKSDPDLIIVLGDLVEDWAVRSYYDADGTQHDLSYEETLQNCREAIRFVFAPIIASGVPYTAVLGNNDYKSGVTPQDWYALLKEQNNIILPETIENSDGRIDNRLAVRDTKGSEALRLFLLDTGTDGVTREQIQAFEQNNDRRDIPAIVFQHIPVNEYVFLWRFCFPWEENAFPLGDHFFIKRADRLINRQNRFCTGSISRQFAGWKRCGNVAGAYFGHLHNISAEGTYHGIRLCAVYGDRWDKNCRHGAALLTVSEDDVQNWETIVYRYTGSVVTGGASLDAEACGNIQRYTTWERLVHEWLLFRNFISSKKSFQ